MKNETELEYPETAFQTDAVEEETGSTAGNDDNDMAAEMSWSPGALIRRAREARKLSLEALSLQTKLPMRVLRAMEIDDFDVLAEPVFARGYYRSCAQVLGIPAGEVTNAYERASGEPPPSPLPLKPTVGEEDLRSPSPWLPYLVLAVVAGGLVALILWWGQPVTHRLLDTPHTGGQTSAPVAGNGDAVVPASSPADATSLAPDAARVKNPVADDTVAAAAVTAAAPAPVASGGADAKAAAETTSSPAATTTTAAVAAPAPAAAGTGTLKVDFTQKSWVRITDATGERLLNGLIPGGTQRKLSGEPPFNVLLGYAPGVNLSYDGKAVSLNDYIQSNNTAHLTIGGP